jgi:magnesium transporter
MEENVVEEVVELIEGNVEGELGDYLDALNISDVEHLIDELPQHAVKFIDSLSVKRAVNVFRILDRPRKRSSKNFPEPSLHSLSTFCLLMTVQLCSQSLKVMQ